MTIYGKIVDKETNAPLSGASVTLSNGNVMLTGTAASNEGMFYLNTSQYPTLISISNTGYKNATWPLPDNEDKTYFELEKNYSELDNVTVTTGKKNWSWVLWAGIIALFVKEVKGKK